MMPHVEKLVVGWIDANDAVTWAWSMLLMHPFRRRRLVNAAIEMAILALLFLHVFALAAVLGRVGSVRVGAATAATTLSAAAASTALLTGRRGLVSQFDDLILAFTRQCHLHLVAGLVGLVGFLQHLGVGDILVADGLDDVAGLDAGLGCRAIVDTRAMRAPSSSLNGTKAPR